MKKPVTLSPRADRDVDEIFAFLRKRSPQGAVRFLDAMEASLQLLGEHPGVGSVRHAEIFPELSVPLRFHPLTDYPRILVYYLNRPDVVEVVRVWDAARGLEALGVEEPAAAYELSKTAAA